jgi:Tfp pilus assembly protein PilO
VSRRAPLIVAIVGVVVALLVVVGLILPKQSAVTKKQGEIDLAQQQESQLRTDLAQLKDVSQQAGQLRKRESRLAAEVPPTADLPGIIRLLNTTALRSAVDFMSVSPGQPAASASGTTSTIPVQVNVGGGFFAVDQFLQRLERLSRAAKVTTITVTPGEAGSGTVSIAMTVEFYTTDSSAGPGSVPGSTQGVAPTVPGTSPSPAASASPTSGGTS